MKSFWLWLALAGIATLAKPMPLPLAAGSVTLMGCHGPGGGGEQWQSVHVGDTVACILAVKSLDVEHLQAFEINYTFERLDGGFQRGKAQSRWRRPGAEDILHNSVWSDAAGRDAEVGSDNGSLMLSIQVNDPHKVGYRALILQGKLTFSAGPVRSFRLSIPVQYLCIERPGPHCEELQ